MYVERFLEKKIKKYLKDREIIAIVGARQCGKTTLMKEIFSGLKHAEFISFEDRDILDLFSNHLKEFIEKYAKDVKYLFIDEFQYAKEGGKQLKYLYDSFGIKIIISGSSSSDLTVQSIKHLVGRILVFALYPFSFEEFLKYNDKKIYQIYEKREISETSIKMINRYYEDYLIYGGYPRVVLEKDYEKKKEVLRNIYNTYLLKEIKEILQITEDQKINGIVKALALQLGSLINFNEISSMTLTDHNRLRKYIEILKKTFVGIEVKPFFRNKRKELVKIPKFYFLDNGFRNVAINNFQEIKNRTDLGALNENFVASELTKRGFELKYWRTKVGAEVDFVFEEGGEIVPIEVKSHLKSSKLTRSFRNFVQEYKPEQGFILSLDYTDKIKLGKSVVYYNPLFTVGKIGGG